MKKNIFKIMLGLVVLFLIPCMAFAQDEDMKDSTPEERAEVQTDWMKSELSLDSTVVPSVYAINLKYAKKNQSLMSSSNSKMQKYREFKASSDAKDGELKAIFTKEQYKKYQQKKEEMKQKIKERIKEKRKKN